MKNIILCLFICLCTIHNHGQTNVKDSLQNLLKREKQDTSKVMLLAQLSFIYASNKPDTAMLLALEALTLSQRMGFIKGEAVSLYRIGWAYNNLGNSSKSMEYSIKSLRLNEKINNLEGIAISLNNIGNIYREKGEYRQAIDFFIKSKELNEQLHNREGVAVNIGNLGRSYLGLMQYDTARVYAQQAYETASKFNYDRRTGNFLILIGSIYSETGQRKLAMEYYHLGIPYLRMMELDQQLSASFLGMAKLFEMDGQKDSALFYANQAFKINKAAGFSSGILDASSFLSSFYHNRQNVDSAFFYLKIATSAKDSLYSKEKINQFQGLSFDEKLRQMEITTAKMKSNEERNRNLQFIAIAIVLITFITLFLALSRSIIVKTRFIEFFGVLGLLAVFEFINLFIHPFLAHATGDSPVLMLLILITQI